MSSGKLITVVMKGEVFSRDGSNKSFYKSPTNWTGSSNSTAISRVWGDYGITTSIVCMVILLFQLLALYGMVKMRQLHFAARFLFCCNLCFDCCFMALLLVLIPVQLLRQKDDLFNEIGTEIGTEIGRLLIAGSWSCLTMLSMERLFCVAYPNRYLRVVFKRRIIIIFTTFIYTVWTIKLSFRYLILPQIYELQGYRFDALKDADIMTWILGFCLTICLLCNCIIAKIVNHHRRRIYEQSLGIADGRATHSLRLYKSTSLAWVLILFFVILYMPLLFVKVLRSSNSASSLRATEFILMLVNSCASPFVYAWRLQECRYHILALFAKCNPKIAVHAEGMRMEVYNICVAMVSHYPNSTV